MITPLRSLTDAGLQEFRRCLQDLRLGDITSLPTELLNDARLTKKEGDILVADVRVSSKLDLATYLTEKIDLAGTPDLLYNTGMWSWLAVVFFNQICPDCSAGGVKQDYRYILERDYRHRHRHLIAGPVRLYLAHGAHGARLLLSHPVHVLGEFTEQLASRQYIAANSGLMQAAAVLYWDERTKTQKKGAAPNERRPGTLRRFIDVVEQFDTTYDTYAMTGDQVVSLLPAEFNSWLS
jgi:hypothetical protein